MQLFYPRYQAFIHSEKTIYKRNSCLKNNAKKSLSTKTIQTVSNNNNNLYK